MAPKAAPGPKPVASNRRARHDYDILEKVECGIVLTGSEVKSLRLGKATLREAYAKVEDGEMWLHAMHIPPYAYAGVVGGHEPERKRKLLLHRKQIADYGDRVARQGLTLVPLSVYFHEGRAKVELGLARGRKHYDKRHAIAARDAARDLDRSLSRGRRRDR